jgi:hypothetical protein
MKKYRIGKNGKLVLIGESKNGNDDKPQIVELSEMGTVDGFVPCTKPQKATQKIMEGSGELSQDFIDRMNAATRQKAEEKSKESLAASFKRLHPEWSEKQIRLAVQGRK